MVEHHKHTANYRTVEFMLKVLFFGLLWFAWVLLLLSLLLLLLLLLFLLLLF